MIVIIWIEFRQFSLILFRRHSRLIFYNIIPLYIAGIVVVNPQRKLTSVIQSFTWGVGSSSCKTLFPAGLTVDPRTNSLVLNSRTGHVQFYDTHSKSLLYNVSKIITNQI